MNSSLALLALYAGFLWQQVGNDRVVGIVGQNVEIALGDVRSGGGAVLTNPFAYSESGIKNPVELDGDLVAVGFNPSPFLRCKLTNPQYAAVTARGNNRRAALAVHVRPDLYTILVSKARLYGPSEIKRGRGPSIEHLNIERDVNCIFHLLDFTNRLFPIYEGLQLEARRALLMRERFFSFEIRAAGVERGERGSHNGQKAKDDASEGHPRDVVTNQRASLRGVRRPRLLYEVVMLEAMLFGCLGAAIFLGKGLSPSETRKGLCSAFGAACLIGGGLGLIGLISG